MMFGAALTHGWPGLMMAYAAVQLPMLVGMARARADAHHYLLSPLVAAPLMIAAGAASTLALPLIPGWALTAHGSVQMALGAALSVALGYVGGVTVAQKDADSSRHRRGARVASELAHSPPRAKSRTRSRAITLAGREIAQTDETKHFKLIGTTGTGKSTAIHEILSGALARGDRAVIADPDGGYARHFHDAGRGDVILNPFDARSVKWDLFAEINSAYDVDQLARSLIPDHEGPDRSWRGYARTFFSAVTRQAHEAGITEVGELYRLMVAADTQELRALVEGTPAQPFLDEHNTRMFDSIRSVTSSAVGALEYVAQQNTRGFSVREWIKSAPSGVLFMPYRAGQIASLGSTISAWMRLAIFEAMDREELPGDAVQDGQRGLWFVVDELDALGQIDGLKDALARLRKYGGRCVLGFQSIAQVSSTYGKGDAHTIIENCGNTVIFRCSASEGGGTARFASELIGDREIVRTSVSRSRRVLEFAGSISHSERVDLEAAVLPAQIEQLPDLAGYLKHASDPQWRQVRLQARQAWEQRRPAPSNHHQANQRDLEHE